MPSHKQGIRIAILLGLLLTGLYYLWLTRNVLYPFLLGFLIAYLLNPLVCLLERQKIKRLWGISLIYAVLLGIILLGIIYLFPILMKDIDDFSARLPQIMIKVDLVQQQIYSQYQNSLLPLVIKKALDNLLLSLETGVNDFIAAILQTCLTLISHSLGILISPILAFYMLYDWYPIKDKILGALPGRWRPEIVAVAKDIDKVLSGVIRGQILTAMIVGTVVAGGLSLLHVEFPLIIGIFAGMLDVIPYFGAFLGAAPGIVLALLQSPLTAIQVSILFFIIHQLEGSVIQPKILGESVGLHPLSVIFFVFVGGELGGITGMLLGVPIAAIGKVIGKHLMNLLL